MKSLPRNGVQTREPSLNKYTTSNQFTQKWLHPENQRLHRFDGPAIIYPNGDKKWYEYGQLHRVSGPAIIECWTRDHQPNYYAWYLRDQCHRIGAPAIIDPNTRIYYQHNILHRIDGPAYITPKNNKYHWYIDGNRHQGAKNIRDALIGHYLQYLSHHQAVRHIAKIHEAYNAGHYDEQHDPYPYIPDPKYPTNP